MLILTFFATSLFFRHKKGRKELLLPEIHILMAESIKVLDLYFPQKTLGEGFLIIITIGLTTLA